jgi:NAD(P)H dehydrogenase (quinone)
MDKRRFLKEAGAASLATGVLLASRSSQAQAPGGQVKVLITYHSVTGNTEKMAEGVADGAGAVVGTTVNLKRVSEVTTEDLLSADAVIIGSPVYFGNVSGEVKVFLDNWFLKYGVFRDAKMRNKVAAAFVTGAAISNGKETAMLAIHAALLMNQMVIVSPGGALGAYGASATTGPDSPGIDEKKLESARALGKRVAEFAAILQRGSRT